MHCRINSNQTQRLKDNLSSCKYVGPSVHSCHHVQYSKDHLPPTDCGSHSLACRPSNAAPLTANPSNRCAGSLERRKRRLRNRIERDQRARSQSELNCCEIKDKPHYCASQQFPCGSNQYMNSCCNGTEVQSRTKRAFIHFPKLFVGTDHMSHEGVVIAVIRVLLRRNGCGNWKMSATRCTWKFPCSRSKSTCNPARSSSWKTCFRIRRTF